MTNKQVSKKFVKKIDKISAKAYNEMNEIFNQYVDELLDKPQTDLEITHIHLAIWSTIKQLIKQRTTSLHKIEKILEEHGYKAKSKGNYIT